MFIFCAGFGCLCKSDVQAKGTGNDWEQVLSCIPSQASAKRHAAGSLSRRWTCGFHAYCCCFQWGKNWKHPSFSFSTVVITEVKGDLRWHYAQSTDLVADFIYMARGNLHIERSFVNEQIKNKRWGPFKMELFGYLDYIYGINTQIFKTEKKSLYRSLSVYLNLSIV